MPLFVQVFGQVLGHALGQHGGEHAKALGGGLADLVEQVVDLHLDGPDLDLRIDEAGRADDLFGEDAAGLVKLPVRRGRADEDRLRAHRVPFLELQGSVVHAGRQAETRVRPA